MTERKVNYCRGPKSHRITNEGEDSEIIRMATFPSKKAARIDLTPLTTFQDTGGIKENHTVTTADDGTRK